MNKKCDICGGEIDFDNGGAALMVAFCYDHGTTLSNNAYCGECFNMFLRKPMSVLNDKADLNIPGLEVSE